jgi:ubiquinone/menaquinone biosynthesis C-methylase UbiE
MKWLRGGLGQSWFKTWLDRNASQALSEAGVRKGQFVLDFGCGSGTYTIPAAKLVGETGIVYALDISREALDKVARKAEREGLRNIVRTHSPGGEKIPLEDETVDVMTLIDVLQEIDNKDALFDEACRVLKDDGIVIVYPMHVETEEVKRIAAARGLDLHEAKQEGRILVFRKETCRQHLEV